MKTFLIAFFLLIIINLNAQWEKVADYNVGATGKVTTNNGYVFVYGDDGDYFLYRSGDNGQNWQNIKGSAPEEFHDIHGFNGKLFGVLVRTIYVSEDDGNSWNPVQTVNVTGNGAVLNFSDDGTNLYAASNRRSYYVSEDGGNTWTEFVISDAPENAVMTTFVAQGDLMLSVFAGGSFFSTDRGSSWTQVNAAIPLSGGYSYNSELFGLSFGQGVYKYETVSGSWIQNNQGIPDNGSLVIAKSMYGKGNTLFVAATNIISNISTVYASTDNGTSWSEISLTGMGQNNFNGSNRFIGATSSYLFNFYYGLLDNQNTGIYRSPVTISSVEKNNDGLGTDFYLSQNYPNPFNPSTTIKFSIPRRSNVSLRIFDILGKEIVELVNEELSEGNYTALFDASQIYDNLSSGIYFYRLQTEQYSKTKKLMLIK